jgi:tetratricopeptide (TPR) repeat protein
MAVALGRIGDYDEALRLYEELTPAFPDHPKLWMSYGHILKTVGRQEDSIAAYRRRWPTKPDFGEVWWSLANLKTVRFDDDERDSDGAGPDRRARPGRPAPPALRARQGLRRWRRRRRSFHHYAAGNALRKESRTTIPAR